jgi:hypothetical protein
MLYPVYRHGPILDADLQCTAASQLSRYTRALVERKFRSSQRHRGSKVPDRVEGTCTSEHAPYPIWSGTSVFLPSSAGMQVRSFKAWRVPGCFKNARQEFRGLKGSLVVFTTRIPSNLSKMHMRGFKAWSASGCIVYAPVKFQGVDGSSLRQRRT